MDSELNKLLTLTEAIDLVRSQWLEGSRDIKDLPAIAGRLIDCNVESLTELVLVDAAERINAGQVVGAEAYVKLFPQLDGRVDELGKALTQMLSDSKCQSVDSDEESVGMFSAGSIAVTEYYDSKGSNGSSSSSSSSRHAKRTSDEELPRTMGNFVLEKFLGEGQFGKVYQARDVRLGRKVAIKIGTRTAQPGLSDGFLHEARSISRLDNPTIVKLLQADETEEGLGYLVYEFVDGQPLLDRIVKADYTITECVEWVAAIAEALDYAHRRSVVHRDISPRNIMINSEGEARLLDFGLSSIENGTGFDDKDRILGTPHFMSPEQASGKPQWASAYADIFSLGSVLYLALTGKLPFPGTSIFDVLERVQKAPPASLRSHRAEIPVKLEEACLRAMAKEPQMRFSTGADMSAALLNSIAPAIRPQAGASDRNHSIFLLLGAALTLIGIGITAAGMTLWKAPNKNEAPQVIPYILGLDLVMPHPHQQTQEPFSLLFNEGDKVIDLSKKPVLTLKAKLENRNLARLYILNGENKDGKWREGAWAEYPVEGSNTPIKYGALKNGPNVILLAYSSRPMETPLALSPTPLKLDRDFFDDSVDSSSKIVVIKEDHCNFGESKLASNVKTRGVKSNSVPKIAESGFGELEKQWNGNGIFFDMENMPGLNNCAYCLMAVWAVNEKESP